MNFNHSCQHAICDGVVGPWACSMLSGLSIQQPRWPLIKLQLWKFQVPLLVLMWKIKKRKGPRYANLQGTKARIMSPHGCIQKNSPCSLALSGRVTTSAPIFNLSKVLIYTPHFTDDPIAIPLLESEAILFIPHWNTFVSPPPPLPHPTPVRKSNVARRSLLRKTKKNI